MFKIKASPTFSAPITIFAPGGEAQKLNVVFKHQRADDADDWLKRSDGQGDKRQKALLEVIESWDAEGVPFSAESLGELLQEKPGAGRALVLGYYAALHGNVEKN